MTLSLLAALALVIWLYLVLAHGRFWHCDQRLDDASDPVPAEWPSVVAVVPARNEAAVIGASLGSLLGQDYPGRFQIILVDDHSEDATAAIARALRGAEGRLTVRSAAALPEGWSGKLWAMAEGVAQATVVAPEARYLLLTDADIGHDPGSLRRLVARAEAQRLDLVSQMVLLDHSGMWAGLLIPAFVFFFQKLYPFPRVNDPAQSMAAAAGGCILVRAKALSAAGGIAAIRGALIDDCALAAAIKARGGTGRVWLGLTTRVVSLRPYTRFSEIWNMVARTAYTQLHYSPWLLGGALVGMALTYLLAPLLVLTWPWHNNGTAAGLALAAWGLMGLAYGPTLRLYHKPTRTGVLLPVVGLLYSLMTLASAVRHWRGRGGQWKGRVYRNKEGGATASPKGACQDDHCG